MVFIVKQKDATCTVCDLVTYLPTEQNTMYHLS